MSERAPSAAATTFGLLVPARCRWYWTTCRGTSGDGSTSAKHWPAPAPGDRIVTAPGPDHSVEGARYGDSFRAFVVTSKCADAIPVYRQAKMMSRLGVPNLAPAR